MARKDDEHRDRGDGVCQLCYEEMPCGVLAGEVRRPRVDADELEHQMEASRVEADARQRLGQLLSERLEQLGVLDDGRRVHVPPWSRSVTLQVETLAQIVSLIPNESEGVGDEVLSFEMEE